ncbi:hypothetical protein C4D60_Mb06t17480 [Musa balbisiana]|uniref:Uncharacterized protein n=1 Tax=Musa balbisiana TaxID=52838 RepID=A0A4S8IPE8_MUSBA|nr:hypothetical protein C4D60_Mb06t17480 [Musa balbisiana]
MMRRGRELGTLYFDYTLPFAEREKAEGGLAVARTLSTDASGQNSNHGVIRTQSLVYASHSSPHSYSGHTFPLLLLLLLPSPLAGPSLSRSPIAIFVDKRYLSIAPVLSP